MAIRVVLADDHKIVREGLRTILGEQIDMEVVGEARDGREAVRLCRELEPDVVVMDVAMPDLNGVEASRQIVAGVPRTKVVALSMHKTAPFVSAMLDAGAKGYLIKECAVDEVVQAIRSVARGDAYLSPAISGALLEGLRSGVAGSASERVLTAREREVLQLVAEGHTTRTIADRLHVSTKTVDTHRQQIMAKLGLGSVAELTKYAIRAGLTSLDT